MLRGGRTCASGLGKPRRVAPIRLRCAQQHVVERRLAGDLVLFDHPHKHPLQDVERLNEVRRVVLRFSVRRGGPFIIQVENIALQGKPRFTGRVHVRRDEHRHAEPQFRGRGREQRFERAPQRHERQRVVRDERGQFERFHRQAEVRMRRHQGDRVHPVFAHPVEVRRVLSGVHQRQFDVLLRGFDGRDPDLLIRDRRDLGEGMRRLHEEPDGRINAKPQQARDRARDVVRRQVSGRFVTARDDQFRVNVEPVVAGRRLPRCRVVLARRLGRVERHRVRTHQVRIHATQDETLAKVDLVLVGRQVQAGEPGVEGGVHT